jgi:two-component system, NtrC family, nitrogen regulation response regulator NtrX
MIRQDADPIDLLLPGASSELEAQARRVTMFLRLLSDDARGGSGGRRVRLSAPLAEQELERREGERLLEALIDLMRHHWCAALGAESFLDPEPPELEHVEAWERLTQAGSEGLQVPPIPAPGESALAVARRLLEAGDALGLPPGERALWHTRLRLVAGEADTQEVEAGLSTAVRNGAPPALLGAWLADAAAVWLDRGGVRRALDLLEGHGPPPGGRCATLASWCRTLLGVRGEALFGGAYGAVPPALVELREDEPQTLAAFAGAPAEQRSSAEAICRVGQLDGRGALGASAWLLVSYDGRARVLDADLAPGLRGGFESGSSWRHLSWAQPGQPEHELLLEGRPVLRRRLEGQSLAGALGDGCRALALVPVPGPDGEVAGWLHLEFEHLLLPSRERLAAIGRALAPRLAAESQGTARVVPEAPEAPEAPGSDLAREARAARERFAGLVAGMGTKTQHRRWSGFLVLDGEARCVAQGGLGLDGGGAAGGRALARALATGGAARFHDPDPRLALCSAAASGMVIPARLHGRVVALLAFESERRRDFQDRDVARYTEALTARALELRLEAFRLWHAQRYGAEVSFAVGATGFAGFAARLITAARARAPVAFHGPAGSGRRTLARWLHFESSSCASPLVELPAARLEELPGLELRGALLVTHLEQASAAGARALEAWAAEAGNGRLILSGQVLPSEVSELDPRWARRLERLPLRVPALSTRRAELPGLIATLLGRFGRDEDLQPPELDDAALGCLWRQPWTGGLPELENVLYRLAVARPGEGVGVEDLEQVLAGFGTELTRRLPSRHPDARDVLAALRVTRKDSGRLNKTRAASWLGWDPDTLVARMGDLGLEDVDAPRAWGE